MNDYASLFLLLWLIPVTLQILLPLIMLCGWTVSRVVSPPAVEKSRQQQEAPSELPGLTGAAN